MRSFSSQEQPLHGADAALLFRRLPPFFFGEMSDTGTSIS
jgi:hypothetical protein